MNEKELIGKIHSSMYHQLQVRGYAAPVDVLIDTGILPKQKYEDWRFGRVRYLEAVCNANLKRLSFVLHQMRVYAQAHGLKPSFCYYKRCILHASSYSGRNSGNEREAQTSGYHFKNRLFLHISWMFLLYFPANIREMDWNLSVQKSACG